MPRHAYVVELRQNLHKNSPKSRLASLELSSPPPRGRDPPPKKKGQKAKKLNMGGFAEFFC